MEKLTLGRVRWFWLVALALTLGCRPEVDKVQVDSALVMSEVERRGNVALARPDLDARMEKLTETAFADPEVGKRGEALLGKLGNAPELADAFGAIQNQIGELPAMQRMVQELMASNPGASPDRIGELAGKRIEGVTESPTFDQAFGQAFKHLLERPAVHAAFEDFGRAFASNEQLQRGISKAFESRAADVAFRKRIVELNGGKAPPDAQSGAKLVLEHGFSEERLARFYSDLFALPVLTEQLRIASRDMLASPAFEKHSRAALAALLADAQVQKGAVEAFAALLDKGGNVDTLSAAIRKPLDTPAAESALANYVHALVADPELDAIGNRAITRIVDDPSVTALITALQVDW